MRHNVAHRTGFWLAHPWVCGYVDLSRYHVFYLDSRLGLLLVKFMEFKQ